MRTVIVDGQRLKLDPSSPTHIGHGGEAEVYRHGALALKVFHPVDPSLPIADQRVLQKNLADKGAKLAAFPRGLPSGVLAPIGLAYSEKGDVVGYTMPLLSGMTPILNLSDPDYRVTAKVDHKTAHIVCTRLHDILVGTHAAGVVVGDLNDGNEMFSVNPVDVKLIDVDSMQFAGHPCVVAAPRFLDPKLYGANLSAGLLTTDTDWYAYTCLLFQSLLCALPFGGMHPKHRTYLRRAENRISVLNNEVNYPAFAVKPDVFPDELIHHFLQVFEKDLRGVFPLKLLQFQWTTCSKCGTEHARRTCPSCSAPGLVVEAVTINRGCTARVVFTTKGAIRALKVEQGRLRVVHEEGSSVYRESGKRVLDGGVPPFVRFSVQGNSTWIGASNGMLLRIENEQLQERTTTSTMGDLAVFDSTVAGVYRIADGYLRRGDSVVGSVLTGRTWLKVGDAFGGFIASTAGATWFYYLFAHDRPGFTTVNLPSPRGTVRDVECFFGTDNCLFLMSEDRSGVIYNSMWLISSTGRVIASAEGEADKTRMLRTIRGKCLVGEKILCSTSEGLLQIVPNGSGGLDESKLFSDTAPFVSDGCPVLQAPTGVWVADSRKVMLLELK